MPDQLFDSLTDEVTVRPLPATEVRRRGDRRRRTRHAALGVAGLAAVAAVVVPVAMTHGTSDDSLPPAVTSPSALTTVPAGFPLTAGMPQRDGVSNQPLAAGPLTSEEEKACGQIVWSAQRPIPTVGGATVTYHDGSEGGQVRSLALYADAEQAGLALQNISTLLASCTSADDGRATIEQLAGATEADQSDVWVVRWTDEQGHPSGEGMVSSATHVGNALLLDSATFMSAGDDAVVQHEAARMADRSASVVAAMCAFSAEGCSTAQESSTPAAPASDVLGPTGYDQLRIGMGYDAATAIGADVAAGPHSRSFELTGHPGAGLCLSRKDGLMAIFLGQEMTTAEGVRIGSSIADLEAAYPGLEPYGPDSKLGGPGIFRADAADGLWYEIDVDQKDRVSDVILRQDHQTCFE